MFIRARRRALRALWVVVASFVGVVATSRTALAHGGRVIQPPPPPPWMRDPYAPGPPGIPPTTPGGLLPPPRPTTPSMPGDPQPGTGPRPHSKAPAWVAWKQWWDANADAFRNPRGAHEVTVQDPLFRVGSAESGAVLGAALEEDRATKRAVAKDVRPALAWALDPKNRCDDDTIASAWIALGKVADSPADVDLLVEQAQRRDLHSVVHEAVTLSLGLLRRASAKDFDGATLDRVRRALFTLLDDDVLPTRTRAFAALSLGLLGGQPTDPADPFARDGRHVVRGLWSSLQQRESSDEVPVAVLVALSMQARAAVASGVLEGLRSLALTGRLEGRAFGRLTRAHAVVALSRLLPDDGGGAGVFLALLSSRGLDEDARRSAIVAISTNAPRYDAPVRVEAAKRLIETSRSGDADTVGLVHVALASLVAADFAEGSCAVVSGTTAEEVLLKGPATGVFEVRPFAALALGLAARPAPASAALKPYASFREKATALLRDGAGDEASDPDSRGAWCLGLGVAADEGGVPILHATASRVANLESLRANACAALGLIGRRTPEVLSVLRTAVAAKSPDAVRRESARALGMLRDTVAVPGLVRELAAGGPDVLLARIVLALGSIGDASAIAPLAAFVKGAGTSDSVRAVACAGLGLLGDVEPVPTLSLFATKVNYCARTDALHEALSLL
jgi:HEAT repeat protein